jgi:hypothetical protein
MTTTISSMSTVIAVAETVFTTKNGWRWPGSWPTTPA